jgi:transcriptional regulator with XRE-family HTH domain
MAAGSTPQAAFARFVRQGVDEAKRRHGWTIADVAAETEIGRSTLFRWLAGSWVEYPELAKVRAFCAALDVPVSAAFRALHLADRPTSGSGQIDRDIRVIVDRLGDPSVPPAEKRRIRTALRRLASRDLRLSNPAG